MPFYTNPRPTGPSNSSSSSGDSISVSGTGAIRETHTEGCEHWSADTAEGAEEITQQVFGRQAKYELDE